MEKIDFVSGDGEVLKCYLFMPKEKPKGVVQIVHGLEEHGLRYADFAAFLNKQGYIVFASDQRLHGKTAGDALSITKIKDVFPVMVEDQKQISDMLRQTYNLPLIIFGHSYGSFIVQSYIQSYHGHSGAILSGSGFMRRPETLAGEVLSWAVLKIKGGEAISDTIENLVIGSFNRSFKKGESWISANKENIKKYESDPLCGNPLCANFYYSMFKNTRSLYSEDVMTQIDKNIPLLLIGGSDDPVGQMGKGLRRLYEKYRSYGINCTLKIYDGLRHEVLNEGEPQVQADILEFLKQLQANLVRANQPSEHCHQF